MNKDLKILVIEDDAVHRAVLENILTDEGYCVVTADNGQEGLDMVAKEDPGLVITDIRMPIKDGYTVCRELRDNPKTKYLPVVILTANHDPDDLVYGFEQGAFDYILKPFENQELMARVNSAVKFKALRDELIAEKQKTVLLELAGGAAHELNQPLTIIKTTAYLLKTKIVNNKIDQDEFLRYFGKVEKAIDRMSAIIGNMKNLEEYQTKSYAMGQKIINLLDPQDEETGNDSKSK
jgi:DNA-binding response OmpR family regulator